VEPIIEIENLSKLYRLGTIGTGTLSHDLKRWWTVKVRSKEDPYLKIGQINDRTTKALSDYVLALHDINLKIETGEVLGIIGRNGAGKSTLLKILSRITSPTTGYVRIKGRIASLLEVGTGFHPEMTGRENIYMNGSIMGMKKAEITRKLDEIVDFAGILRYVDTPVKRYSSGMTVRLGFAIAAYLEPEILVVDEVLAVGDAEFQKKAVGKMKDVSTNYGRTVLFVSHNLGVVKELCNKGILLNNGQIEFEGSVEKVIDKYLNEGEKESDPTKRCILKKFGIQIISIHKKQNGNLTESAFFNEEFSISILCERISDNHLITDIVIQIINEFGQKVTSINSAEEGLKSSIFHGLFRLELGTSSINLFPGRYTINLMFVSSIVTEMIENIDSFEILPKQINYSGWSYNSNHGIARVFDEFKIVTDNLFEKKY